MNIGIMSETELGEFSLTSVPTKFPPGGRIGTLVTPLKLKRSEKLITRETAYKMAITIKKMQVKKEASKYENHQLHH